MIIWGSKGREIDSGGGEFFCPECGGEQSYRKVRIAAYFTLYFIPLFETEHHGTYVKCRGCKQMFKEAVLDYRPPTKAELMFGSVRADLESGTPVQMAVNKLVNAGADKGVAEAIVQGAAEGDPLRECRACHLSYVDAVAKCTACGAAV